MKRFCSCARWTGLGLALMLSPALVVFAAPFGYGILRDLMATAWLAPVSLTVAAAIALNAMRRGALQAAKSIT
jgi:hypothetical protein